MIPSPSRLLKCAPLLLAVACAPGAFAQSSSPFLIAADRIDSSFALPDAPSFSSSQDKAPVQAQEPQTTPPPDETPEQRKIREREEAEQQVKVEEKQRIGGIMPNFNVNMGGAFVPLTPKEKFSLSWHTIIDPYTIALAFVVGGGLGEIEDDHQGYDWGPAGYFKRTGASYLDNVDGNFIGNFLLPVVLHQDPRYFRKGEGSIKSRIIYSALTTFICKGDNGKRQPNFSNVLGNFISGGISNAYYPAEERGAGLTIDNAVVVTLEGMLGAQLFEFSPDVTEYLHKRRDRHRQAILQQADATAAAKTTAQPPAAAAPQQ